MLIFTSIILITLGVLVSATEDDFCSSRPPLHCYTPGQDVVFPDSEEALDKICPILIPRFKCLLDFKNNCSGDKEMRVEFFNLDNIHSLLVDACDRDSRFHKELALHLPCIEKNLMSYKRTCRPMVRELMKEINIDFESENIFSDEEDSLYAKFFCISQTLDMSCFVAITSVRCGEKTGEMVGEVMDMVGFVDSICPESIREEVKAAVAIVQPEMNQRIAKEEIFSEIK